MLDKAAEARLYALGQLTGHTGPDSEREALAGMLFRRYSCELLDELLRVAPAEENGGAAAWVRRRHDEQLLELGRELRDAFPEGEPRHAVAQIIQRELLEAERRLKSAFRTASIPASREQRSTSEPF